MKCAFSSDLRSVDNSTVVEHGREYGMSMITGTPGTLSLKTTSAEAAKGFVSSQIILESILNRERSGKNGLNGFQLLFQLRLRARQTDKFYTRSPNYSIASEPRLRVRPPGRVVKA